MPNTLSRSKYQMYQGSCFKQSMNRSFVGKKKENILHFYNKSKSKFSYQRSWWRNGYVRNAQISLVPFQSSNHSSPVTLISNNPSGPVWRPEVVFLIRQGTSSHSGSHEVYGKLLATSCLARNELVPRYLRNIWKASKPRAQLGTSSVPGSHEVYGKLLGILSVARNELVHRQTKK